MGLMDTLKSAGQTATRMAPALRVLGARDKRDLYPAIDSMNNQQAQFDAEDKLDALSTALANDDITSYADLQKSAIDAGLSDLAIKLEPKVMGEQAEKRKLTGLSGSIDQLSPGYQLPEGMDSAGASNIYKMLINNKAAAAKRNLKLTDAETARQNRNTDFENQWQYKLTNPKPTAPPKPPKLPRERADAERLGLNYSDEIQKGIVGTGLSPAVVKEVVDKALSIAGDEQSFRDTLSGIFMNVEGARPQSSPIGAAPQPVVAPPVSNDIAQMMKEYYREQKVRFNGNAALAQKATREAFAGYDQQPPANMPIPSESIPVTQMSLSEALSKTR